jgi:two-component system chemotaxis response regulator CheB
MLVEHGGRSIALSTDSAVRFARPSIDVLFESLAYSVGRDAIAIVLTGASDDGARGAEAVKRVGGRVLVQTPDSAESSVAPSASLARFTPDAVLDVEAMPGLLCTWLMPGASG